MNDLLRGVVQFLRSDEGPTVVEYAVLLAVISMGVLLAMAAFGDHMDNVYTTINTGVDVF